MSPATVEHLVLEHKLGMGWVTKYHDLGPDLQGALEVLEAEGWAVAAPFTWQVYREGVTHPHHALILQRRHPDAGDVEGRDE